MMAGRGLPIKKRPGSGLLKAFALLYILTLAAGCGYFKDDSGEVIIKVNGRSITAGEYRDALKRLVPSEKSEEAGEFIELKKELVAEMVEEELLLEEAERAGVTVGAAELAAEVDLIKKEYGDASFRAAIESRYGSLGEWEEKIKRKLLVKKAIESITSLAKVSEKEARQHYEQNKEGFSRPEQVRARMIVVASEEDATEVRERITPENFGEIAKEVSLSPEGKEGGSLGYFGAGDMPNEFEAVVFSLKPGEISQVVKTEYGFHIFLLEEKRKGGPVPYPEVRARIVERLKNEKTAAILDEWIAERKRSSRIEIREGLL